MVDFTSMCYLGGGAQASPSALPLSLGVPAAVHQPPGSAALAKLLARATGRPQAVLGASSLHLFHDLSSHLAASDTRKKTVILTDSGLYQVPRWTLAQAQLAGVPVLGFGHHAVADLAAKLERLGPVRAHVYCDGYCPRCGQLAPLAAYGALVRKHGGLLVIDDTQAIGLLGQNPSPLDPYGQGGGGSLAYLGLDLENAVVVASLAKSLATPLAFLAGPVALVAQLKHNGATQGHCSPPAIPLIEAARQRLRLLHQHGPTLRRKLWARVDQFRNDMACARPLPQASFFPMQYLALPADLAPQRLLSGLARRGLNAVAVQGHGGKAQLLLVFRADHRAEEIGRLTAVLRSYFPAPLLSPGDWHGAVARLCR